MGHDRPALTVMAQHRNHSVTMYAASPGRQLQFLRHLAYLTVSVASRNRISIPVEGLHGQYRRHRVHVDPAEVVILGETPRPVVQGALGRTDGEAILGIRRA